MNSPEQPRIHLPSGFKYGDVDFSPNPVPKEDPPPPLGVLEFFNGIYAGTGLNTIFRPNSVAPTTTTFPNPVTPAPPAPPNVAVLELNLTEEQLTFSKPLGSVPNRGLIQQNDIFLNGVSYLQTINDVTNTATGKGDGAPTGIHTETGFWLNVPETKENPKEGNTLVRLASIPHGTTINAQGNPPVKFKGPPSIEPIPITPFKIGNEKDRKPEASQMASNSDTARLPQDLTRFAAEGTITQAILDNPPELLTEINKQIHITETLAFEVTTESSPSLLGGGTANIAFLVGQKPVLGPNADAAKMESTFWVETVEAKVTIPRYIPGQDPSPLLLKPDFKPSKGKPVPPLPTFAVVPPPRPIEHPKTITVHYTQIQYAQEVYLNFHGLTWPHVSVATLVPTANIAVPSAFDHQT